MEVTGTTSVGDALKSANAQSGASTTLDYEAFLTLLVAQLNHQDPTEPQDSTEYVAQLANFSNVEQGVQTNAKLDAMLTSFALLQSDSVIGRTITSADGTISGVATSIQILDGEALAVLSDGKQIPLGDGITIS